MNNEKFSKQRIGKLNEAMKRHEGLYLPHCALGTRVAMLLALSRTSQNGWTAERTFQETESMGFNLRSSANFAAFVNRATRK